MKLSNIHHPFLAEDRRRALVLWLLFCASMWGLGIAVTVLLIEKLYFR
jgi:hypothetical protein